MDGPPRYLSIGDINTGLCRNAGDTNGVLSSACSSRPRSVSVSPVCGSGGPHAVFLLWMGGVSLGKVGLVSTLLMLTPPLMVL